MIGLFARLWWWSFRGRVRRTLRLLRQPKYALGFMFGLSYFGWLVFRPMMEAGGDNEAFLVTLDLGPGIHLILALVAALYVSTSWLLAPIKDGLKLRGAEMHFLLPGPVSRRTVISYAVLKSTPSFLLTGAALSLFLTSGDAGTRFLHALFLAVMFALWDFHGKARNQIRAWATRRPAASLVVAGVRLALGLYAAVLVGLVAVKARLLAAAFAELGDRAESGGAEAVVTAVHDLLSQGPLIPLLTPFLWITGGRFVDDPGQAALSWLLDGALLFVLFRVILAVPTRLEAAAEGSKAEIRALERRGRLSASRRGRHLFALPRRSRPALIILWKDLLLLTRVPGRWVATGWLGLLLGVVGVVAWLGPPAKAALAPATVLMAVSTWVVLFTGILWTNGFRRDLPYLESLRSWPIAGRSMVLGQALAPVVQAGAVVLAWATLAVALDVGIRLAARLGTGGATDGLTPEVFLPSVHTPSLAVLPLFLAGVVPVMLAVAFTSASLECVTTLLFPGWLLVTDRQKADPAAIGQRMLFAVGFFFAMAIGLIPGAIVVGAVLLLQPHLGIPVVAWELPFLGLLAALPVFLEGALLIRIGGALWNRMDPSLEILEGFR